MNNYEFTFLSEQNVSQVADIENATFSEPWSADALRHTLSDDKYRYLIIMKENMVIGYAGVLCIGDEGQITNVAIAEPYRGRGYGEVLIRHLLRMKETVSVKRFFLEVRKGNEVARYLYQKVGFEELGIRKDFYKKPCEDAVVMFYTKENILLLPLYPFWKEEYN